VARLLPPFLKYHILVHWRWKKNTGSPPISIFDGLICVRLMINVEKPKMNGDPELLLGLSADELEALADSMLTPVVQTRLDDLLARKKERQISAAEETELDGLLQKIDHLTILKTRARFTLNHERAEATGT
jgi:hypothetical protein